MLGKWKAPERCTGDENANRREVRFQGGAALELSLGGEGQVLNAGLEWEESTTKPGKPPPDLNRDRDHGEKALCRGNMEAKAGKVGWGQLLEALSSGRRI